MTKTENQLEDEIEKLQGKILSAGQYMQADTENLVSEGYIIDDGLTITDPVEKADDLVKVAHEVKKMAIQYQALLSLQEKLDQNKKVTNSSNFGDAEAVND